MHFDFSDHIVLNVVQYMLPCILEIHFSLCSILGYLPITTSAGNHAVESSESNEKHNTSNVASGLTQNGSFGTALLSALYTPRAELISLFIAFALLAVSARSLLLTCMFFHTYAENAVGLLIALTVAGLPLYSKNVTNLWVARVLQ